MEGVRRWMGSNAPSITSVRRVNKKPIPDKAAATGRSGASKENDHISNDPMAIENVVARLLDPVVPEEEEAEYQWFVSPVFTQHILTSNRI